MVRSSLTYIHYLDQPSQGFNQSTKKPSESKTTFTCKLQGELTQAQSLTNPKSYQTLFQRKDRKEKYVMITIWSDNTKFSSLQKTSLKDKENEFLKFSNRERWWFDRFSLLVCKSCFFRCFLKLIYLVYHLWPLESFN